MELNQELEWAAARPESLWGKLDGPTQLPDCLMPNAFESCLTKWEHDAYQEYIRQWPNGVYSMNQNPLVRATLARSQAANRFQKHCFSL